MAFDKWTLLKVFEVGFTVACLICKRITDDEASRLFLFLQKLSREWSLLNNVTWDKLGAAIADTAYGGYIIITSALLVGRLTGELPTARRITEIILLGIGALLYIVLGSLVFASLDSVPQDLVDNAAVLGTLSLITGALFLLDLGGPRAKKQASQPHLAERKISKPIATSSNEIKVVDMEPEFLKVERKEIEALEMQHTKRTKPLKDQNGIKNGHKISVQNGIKGVQLGYKKMKEEEDTKRKFDIYGKDMVDYDEGAKEVEEEMVEKHSPVWSQIRKGHYGKYDVVVPSYVYSKTDTLPLHQRSNPSSPTDPGYVQYTAQHWGQKSQNTPGHSPSQV